MAFINDIEDYIGTFSDTTAISLWLNRGAQFILMRLPEDAVRHLATSEAVSGSGIDIYGKRILDVHALYYSSKEYPVGMKARLVDSGSIYKATATSPAHVIDGTKLYIYPSGGTVLLLALPTAIAYSDTAMASVPLDMVHAVILYAAIQGQIYKINALDFAGITLSLPVIPNAPNAPSLTFSEVSPSLVNSTTIGSLGAPPSYSAVVSDTPTFDLTSIGTAPTALSAPAFTYSDVLAETINITKIIDLASAFTTVGDYIDTLNDFELAQAKLNEIQTKIQEFIGESNLALQEASKNAELTTDTNLKNELQRVSTEIQQYTATVQRYSGELNKYQTDINAKAQEYQLTLSAWSSGTQANLSNALNQFQAEVVPYQANIQKIITQAQLDQQVLLQVASNTDNINMQNEARELERQIAEYRFTLEKFSSELQAYSVQVNGEVSRVGLLLNKYNAQYTQMQGVLANLQNEFNKFLNYYGIK